jgi:uncharacterized protein YcbK (DUF882 family)
VTKQNASTYTRRQALGFGVGFAALAASPKAFALPAILRGAGDIRSIRIVNSRTGDKVDSVYWIEGQYIPEVLSAIDFLMRDWRTDQVKQIDPGLLDIAAATHKLLDTREPFTLYSGYRSPRTNRLLAARSRGVASGSYHVKGMAADLHLESRSVRQIAAAAASLSAGGIGKYSRSNFVHLDCGPIRSWGR